MIFVSKLLTGIGLVSLIISGIFIAQFTNPNRLSFETPNYIKDTKNTSYDIQPVRMIIPSTGVNVPIIPSEISQNSWQTTDKGVSYLKHSPIPGDTGNSIIYGHNFKNLLGTLPQTRPGQTIDIIYSDNSKKTFVIQYTSIVSPKQVDILNPTTDRRITVYTCTGLLDSKRFVATAILKS